MNFYNEHDPKAAAWLRELIKSNLIPTGIVDERSIEDIIPTELNQYTQCHFFAGIGGWSLALCLAGWPEDRPVWTGSCPCQPFSTAGKGGGFADERHLWPAFHHLISQCQPPVVFGEQVASKDGLAWLDLVRADLEASGYAVGASDLCAASVGAPHIRQRLWWVADGNNKGLEGRWKPGCQRASERASRPGGVVDRLANPTSREEHQELHGPAEAQGGRCSDVSGGCGLAGGLDDAHFGRREGDEMERVSPTHVGRPVTFGSMAKGEDESRSIQGSQGLRPSDNEDGGSNRPGPLHGFWRNADWLHCRDGKWRPVESGTFPLAHGVSARVVRLRGYGNAIVPQVAAAFIEASAKAITQ
jgi:DNA (cytosine-5)-methyltransferase 1